MKADVRAAKNTPRAYNELVAIKTAPGQIPPWVMRPDDEGTKKTGEGTLTSKPKVPTSHEVEVPSEPKDEVPPSNPSGTVPPGAGDTEPPEALMTSHEVGTKAPDLNNTSPDLNSTSPNLNEGTYEVIPRGGNRLGAVYDGAREQTTRLQAMGIVARATRENCTTRKYMILRREASSDLTS